ncbi:MAG: bacteriohemerythrin [Wenzhouxiangellaceae bacterium]|nr:bacteriohemerythrin [Wenzhouxiangellaceae bacterium]
METFQWTPNFVTNLPKVDRQHRHLVDLINQLGGQLGDDGVATADLEALFAELVDYSLTHFSDEEQLMRGVGVDPRHVEAHVRNHQRFVADVQLLKDSGAMETAEMAARLLDYLVHWLTYHILGQDQDMAAQIAAIRAGSDAAAAFAISEREQEAAVEPLLTALNGLMTQLSQRNRELQDLNRTLEQRVEARTRQLAEANQRLETLSLTDALTGLSNRRHAMLMLGACWREAVALDQPLALLMIDADHFKEVNDKHGHDAGDRVLVELSRELTGALRTDDRVFRLGGDEFLVLCPNTDHAGAMQVANHLVERVAALRVATGDSFWHSSLSVGVATRVPAMQVFDELIKAADAGVYRAKRDGRNCVRSVQARH